MLKINDSILFCGSFFHKFPLVPKVFFQKLKFFVGRFDLVSQNGTLQDCGKYWTHQCVRIAFERKRLEHFSNIGQECQKCILECFGWTLLKFRNKNSKKHLGGPKEICWKTSLGEQALFFARKKNHKIRKGQIDCTELKIFENRFFMTQLHTFKNNETKLGHLIWRRRKQAAVQTLLIRQNWCKGHFFYATFERSFYSVIGKFLALFLVFNFRVFWSFWSFRMFFCCFNFNFWGFWMIFDA
jgi:hypothetical protein